MIHLGHVDFEELVLRQKPCEYGTTSAASTNICKTKITEIELYKKKKKASTMCALTHVMHIF